MRIVFGVICLMWSVLWFGHLFLEWEVSATQAAAYGTLALTIIFLDKALGGK